MIRILFIDDDLHTHRVLKMVLPRDFTVISSTRGLRGIELVEEHQPDLVLLDIELPDIDGIEVLKTIVANPSSPPVIMLTGYSETSLVVRAIQSGACDYITKPYELRKLTSSIEKAVRINEKLQGEILHEDEKTFSGFIGESPKIKEIKKRISLFSRTDKTVLLTGESGTGKEIVAGMIHSLSARKHAPFLAVNCGAIPEQLFETELFGSQKGAYTDAVTREGNFEAANNGTLFLDEIGELSIPMQVKLLRVIENKEITRVGSSKTRTVNVRIITATNSDLMKAVKMNQFRKDLFYRINVLEINLPPLRERMEDLPLLINHFLSINGCSHYTLSPASLEKLQKYQWPGNIRELRTVIERAVLFSKDQTISPEDISM